jgi:hypothetical protein
MNIPLVHANQVADSMEAAIAMMVDHKPAGKKMSRIAIMCGLFTTDNIKMALQHCHRHHPSIPSHASDCELQTPFSLLRRKTLALKEYNAPREVIGTDPRELPEYAARWRSARDVRHPIRSVSLRAGGEAEWPSAIGRRRTRSRCCAS